MDTIFFTFIMEDDEASGLIENEVGVLLSSIDVERQIRGIGILRRIRYIL